MWSITISTAPTVEPVSAADAKAHLRVTHTNDDSYITNAITAARKQVEMDIGRSLIAQTAVYRSDRFPKTPFCLPNPPISAVSSITYYDSAGATQTVATTNYALDSYSGQLDMTSTGSWPEPRGQAGDVTITYTAGYGTAATHVPEGIIHAIKLLVTDLYENRNLTMADAVENPAYRRLLMPYNARAIVG